MACRVSARVMFDLVFVSIAWVGTHGDAVATVEPLCLDRRLSGILYVSAEVIVDKISPGKEIAAAGAVMLVERNALRLHNLPHGDGLCANNS